MRFSFLTVPAWMRVLVIPALFLRLVLVYRVVARLAGTAARGRLPVTRGWWWAFMAIRWGSRALFWAALLLFVWALFTTGSPGPDLLFKWMLVALFASLLLSWVAWPAVRPRVTVRRGAQGTWIELRGAHRRFVEAVGRRAGAG